MKRFLILIVILLRMSDGVKKGGECVVVQYAEPGRDALPSW